MTEEDIVDLTEFCDATHSVCANNYNVMTGEVIKTNSEILKGKAKMIEKDQYRITDVANFRFFISMNPGHPRRKAVFTEGFPGEQLICLTVPD